MGIGVALVNVLTGLLQVIAWRKKAPHIRVSPSLVEYRTLKAVAGYCSLQSIGSVAMLCIAGLDTAIVGHFDYPQTAYYFIATLPTSFVVLILSTMVGPLGPLMPASSAMSTKWSPAEMGDLLAKVTRYTTVVLLLTGLPLMVCGFPILCLWVGPVYALHTLKYLRILVLANIIRNLFAPYATMIAATGRQGAATAAAVSEAVVNLTSSIYLASRFGAIGVALGTLVGSFVSISLHFAITMSFTYRTFAISRSKLFAKGLLQPASIAIPSAVLFTLWWPPDRMTLSPLFVIIWTLTTIAVAWCGGLNGQERVYLTELFRNRLVLRSG
jgi:O-antigen/teichoic acid export membrane protein